MYIYMSLPRCTVILYKLHVQIGKIYLNFYCIRKCKLFSCGTENLLCAESGKDRVISKLAYTAECTQCVWIEADFLLTPEHFCVVLLPLKIEPAWYIAATCKTGIQLCQRYRWGYVLCQFVPIIILS